MRKINEEEIKGLELEILQQIHDLCEKLDLHYSLAYGTLIGAVRHKGFIPWDDDIDIVMPRDDYRAFIEYCRGNETPFRLIANELNADYHTLFAKACAKNTIIRDRFSDFEKNGVGVFVDIIPFDGLGNCNYSEACKNLNKTVFERRLQDTTNWKTYSKSITHPWYYEPIRFAFFLMSRCLNANKYSQKVNQDIQKFPFCESTYVSAICVSSGTKTIQKKELFDNYIELEFEGRMFKTVAGYDGFLRSVYGDYLKIPPKEQQVSYHSFDAFFID